MRSSLFHKEKNSESGMRKYKEEYWNVSRSFSVKSTGPVSATARWATADKAIPAVVTAVVTATAPATIVIAVVAHGLGS